MDDPFEILGIPRDADERTIKKAYARLIKIHRPERDPDGFQRAHGAYEAVLGLLRGVPRMPVFMQAQATRQISEDLTWRELRAQIDREPDEVADALERRILRLYETNQLNQLWVETSDPSMIDAALAHPEIAVPVLRVIAAMAWYRPEAGWLLSRMRAIPRTHRLERLCDFVENELALAHRFFVLRNGGFLHAPEPLVRLLGDRVLASPERRLQIRRDVAFLLGTPDFLLGILDRLVDLDARLAIALVNRLGSELPRGAADGEILPPGVSEVLLRRLDDLDHRPWHLTLRYSAAIDGTAAVFDRIANFGKKPRRLTPPDYLRRVRPRVAEIVAELGVTVAAVQERLASRPLDRRYDKIVLELLDRDLALTVLGVIAAIVRSAAPRSVA